MMKKRPYNPPVALTAPTTMLWTYSIATYLKDKFLALPVVKRQSEGIGSSLQLGAVLNSPSDGVLIPRRSRVANH